MSGLNHEMRVEALRDRIFAALARGDENAARKGIKQLHRAVPAEAAGLLTALHIEAGRTREALGACGRGGALL